jgi:hypothetical protein
VALKPDPIKIQFKNDIPEQKTENLDNKVLEKINEP